jgi:catechol 1,2-dioxygenase
VHNDDDVAQAVKPELMLDPQPDGAGGKTAVYNYVLDKA